MGFLDRIRHALGRLTHPRGGPAPPTPREIREHLSLTAPETPPTRSYDTIPLTPAMRANQTMLAVWETGWWQRDVGHDERMAARDRFNDWLAAHGLRLDSDFCADWREDMGYEVPE